MKRTVNWLTKLFVSSVVAMALAIALGVQQVQAAPYCCTGKVTSLEKPGEACTVEYTEKYPFFVAEIGNDSSDFSVVDVTYPGGYKETFKIPPYRIAAAFLPPKEKEEFVLAEGGPVYFECYE